MHHPSERAHALLVCLQNVRELTSALTSMSARPSISAVTTSRWPLSAATTSGVVPYCTRTMRKVRDVSEEDHILNNQDYMNIKHMPQRPSQLESSPSRERALRLLAIVFMMSCDSDVALALIES